MKSANGVKLAGLMLAGATLFFMGGCGFKNPPVAPEEIVPTAINDLMYTVGDDGIKLTWSYPTRTVKGTDITEISSFELYSAEVDLKDYCKTCPIPFGSPLEVAAEAINEQEEQQATYMLNGVRPGYRYFYKVRTRTDWWAASDDSNIITFVKHTPVGAVGSLATKGGDGSIMVSWQPATTLTDGSPVDGEVQYQVMRSANGKTFEKLGKPVTTASYTDTKAAAGKKYTYKVQSQIKYEGVVMDGKTSAPVSSMSADVTAPVPPAGVKAIKTAGTGIKIVWSPSSEKDLKGYKVYRRTASEDDPKVIGQVEAGVTIFEDTTASEDERYYYSVTAFDTADPANESDSSREASVRE